MEERIEERKWKMCLNAFDRDEHEQWKKIHIARKMFE